MLSGVRGAVSDKPDLIFLPRFGAFKFGYNLSICFMIIRHATRKHLMPLDQMLTDEFDLTMLLRPPRALHVDTLHRNMTFNQLVVGSIPTDAVKNLNSMNYLQRVRLGKFFAFSGQVTEFAGLDSSD